jgi:hypothetical protein
MWGCACLASTSSQACLIFRIPSPYGYTLHKKELRISSGERTENGYELSSKERRVYMFFGPSTRRI